MKRGHPQRSDIAKAADALPSTSESNEPLAKLAIGRRLPPLGLLIWLADHLFYGHQPGWTLGLFGASTVIATTICNPSLLASPIGRLLLVLSLGAAGALVVHPTPLAVLVFVACLSSFALANERAMFRDAVHWAEGIGIFITQILPRPFFDVTRLRRKSNSPIVVSALLNLFRTWLLPAGLAAVFTALLSVANPIFAGGLAAFFQTLAFEIPPVSRLLFWLASFLVLWSVLYPWLYPVAAWQTPHSKDKSTRTTGRPPSALWTYLFTPAAVLRSLLLFNAIFAVHNGLDLNYLWAGQSLPDGYTHSSYAHRSAYPLVVTALLAGAFVLLAFPDGSQCPLGRPNQVLVYVWLAQNALLIVFAMWRTASYVQEYALTYPRFAAMIWMALVAFGLGLVALRLWLNKSSRWLLNANAAALAAVLYGLCFVDVGALIAKHNVQNCREVGGNAAQLDLSYMRYIGPSALPALRWYVANMEPKFWPLEEAKQLREELEITVAENASSWRSWTYRFHRIGAASPEVRSISQ